MQVLLQPVESEAFLTALRYHMKHPDAGWFPPERTIRDFRVQAKVALSRQEEPVSVEFFAVQEADPLVGVKRFFILKAPSGRQALLMRESRRVASWLNAHGIRVFYRIDPIYGLILGQAADSVQPDAAQEREYYLITLVGSETPDHPELALQDYVPSNFRSTFLEIFERMNRTRPGTMRFLGVDIARILRRKPDREQEQFFVWHYDKIQQFLVDLSVQYLWKDIQLSIIFHQVEERDFQNSPFHPDHVLFFPNRTFRYFHDVEELFINS